MHSIIAKNVNEALPLGLMYLREGGEEITVRGMRTIEMPTPVCTVYQKPWQRVLFEPLRDANPYFHFMEAMWILAGKNDVHFPCLFNSKLAQYSDDGKLFHGAYGHRLRSCGVDQLKEAVNKLLGDPSTRQAVLQIWDYKKDLNKQSNDIPCNDLIMVKKRNDAINITVCCRSNDVIWGAYGANAVQFSYIQEYLAGMTDSKIGVYRQVSDSFHAYIDNPQWQKLQGIAPNDVYDHEYYPMIKYSQLFDAELEAFVSGNWKLVWHNPFFPEVAIPIWESWFDHKDTKTGWKHAQNIKDTAWQKACTEWLARRNDYAYN